MKKLRKRKFQKTCEIIGAVAITLYAIFFLVERGTEFALPRVIIATVGFAAYSLKCITDITLEEKFGYSLTLAAACIFLIAISVLEMIMQLV